MFSPTSQNEFFDEKQLKKFLMPCIVDALQLKVDLLGVPDQIKAAIVKSNLCCQAFKKKVDTAIHGYNESIEEYNRTRIRGTPKIRPLDEPLNRRMVVEKLACFVKISPDDKISNQLFTTVKQRYISSYQGKRVIGRLQSIKSHAFTFHRDNQEAKLSSSNWWNSYIAQSENEFTLLEKFFYLMPDTLTFSPAVLCTLLFLLLKAVANLFDLKNDYLLQLISKFALAVLVVGFLYKSLVPTTVEPSDQSSEEAIHDIYQKLAQQLRLTSIIEHPTYELISPTQAIPSDQKAIKEGEDVDSTAAKEPKIKTRPTGPAFLGSAPKPPSAIQQNIPQVVTQHLAELKIHGEFKVIKFDWFSATFWAVLPLDIIENKDLIASFVKSFEKGFFPNHNAHAIVFAGSGLTFEIRIANDPRVYSSEDDVIKINSRERIIIFKHYVAKHENTLDFKPG